MKTPEEIKKGLECCMRSLESSVACRECPYQIRCFVNMPRKALLKDVHSLVQQLEAREWDLFDLISSAWFGKRCYFRQDDGDVYSRSSGEYMSFDQAIDELAHELTCERECEQTGKDMNVPRWISVEERLPSESGYYLTVSRRGGFVDMLEYSVMHKAFNAADILAECKNAISVTHWMPLPPEPVRDADELPKEG